MRKILLGLFSVILVIGIDLATLSFSAAQEPIDFRRSLHVTLGQRNLVLEAPRDMCFLDRSSFTQNSIFQTLAGVVERNGDQVVVAAFMNCNDVANLSSLASIPNAGIVTWMNPSIGMTTPMSTQDYLDMREASLIPYARMASSGLTLDKGVHRDTNNVSIGATGEVPGPEYTKSKATTVLATTILRHIPIEITLRYTGNDAPALKDVYPLMDKLMAQQVALNR